VKPRFDNPAQKAEEERCDDEDAQVDAKRSTGTAPERVRTELPTVAL
jgi:hypothetical protein